MVVAEISEFLKIVPTVKRTPHKYLWSPYDTETDVLYINFKKHSHATDSEIPESDVIVRYVNDENVGLTVLRAGKR